jgi:hypothetical protein
MKTLIDDAFMKVIATFLSLLSGQTGYSQVPQGHYEGALTRDGAVQIVSVTFYGDKTTFDMPEIGYMDVLTDKIFWSNDTLNLKLFYGDFHCFLDPKNRRFIWYRQGDKS